MMPKFDAEMIITFIFWIAGSIVTVGGATSILERWAVKFKQPEEKQNARLDDHEKRICKLETDRDDMTEQLLDLKEMSRLQLAQISAIANGDADAIKTASNAISNYLRNKI